MCEPRCKTMNVPLSKTNVSLSIGDVGIDEQPAMASTRARIAARDVVIIVDILREGTPGVNIGFPLLTLSVQGSRHQGARRTGVGSVRPSRKALTLAMTIRCLAVSASSVR